LLVDKPGQQAERRAMIWTLTQVALGGAIGSVARFACVTGAARLFGTGFPLGTLLVNVLGSFAMGLVFVWLSERELLRHAPLLMAGVLGGFTTFSAFSLDALKLWEAGAHGALLAYVLGSVILSVLALWAGVMMMRGWMA
jgi:fluoride exporter